MAVILIIETSTEVCSVALATDGKVIDLIESKEGQNHARLTGVFAEKLLANNQINARDLSAVAVSKGPGSYTGLRIGVSVAKGICYANRIPLIAIGTLEAMSDHVMQNRLRYDIPENVPSLFCPMIDARRMEVFYELQDENGNVIKPITAEHVDETFLSNELFDKQVVFFGNGSEKCKPVIKSPNATFVPLIDASASHMCDLAFQAYDKKLFVDVAYFEPFYLKDFVATVSKKNMLG